MIIKSFQTYTQKLSETLNLSPWDSIQGLALDVKTLWERGNQLFICGNGGSAANAMHMANDFTYGIAKKNGLGLRVNALPSNVSVLTCLANDISYENVFSYQLEVLANRGDMLIVLSGSGNSPNILKALEMAKKIGVKSYAILGYDGGRALNLADQSIHYSVQNMQIAEDCQLVVGHLLMTYLKGSTT